MTAISATPTPDGNVTIRSQANPAWRIVRQSSGMRVRRKASIFWLNRRGRFRRTHFWRGSEVDFNRNLGQLGVELG